MLIFFAILHDQVTAHLCPPYFNQAHPDLGMPAIFHAPSPALLGVAWGIAAGWGPGVLMGCVYAAAAQVGAWPRLGWSRIWPLLALQLLLMSVLSAAVGITSYQLNPGSDGVFYRRFNAVYDAHITTYLGGAALTLLAAATLLLTRHHQAQKRKSPT